MSEILARLRVRETHGIRRFLYPLSATLALPDGIDVSTLGLALGDGQGIPSQITSAGEGQYRLDFAVSLAPLQDVELLLAYRQPQTPVPDPLRLTQESDGTLRSAQERFQIALGPTSEISDVIYDAVPHLSSPAMIHRADYDSKSYKRGTVTPDQTEMPLDVTGVEIGGGQLCAWSKTEGVYADGCAVQVTSEITACKSWVTLHYRLEQPRPSETISFRVPLAGAIASQALSGPERVIFDTGIDGIYGRLPSYFGSFLRWYAPQSSAETIRWEVGVAADLSKYDRNTDLTGRVDYVGHCSPGDFHKQRWFHLVDGSKAIAVAITQVPDTWHSIRVEMRGNTVIRFTLADDATGPAEFGICYHFLNDVPAIAAATSPQSILLPPTVEVLPA